MSRQASDRGCCAHPDKLIATIRKNSREEIRFSLCSYKGVRKIDVRIYEMDRHGVMHRQDKGLAVVPQLGRQMREAYDQALAAAIEEGLLDGGDPE